MADGLRELAGVYLRGLCMGAADAVPGVSGGTIALITGIYGRLVGAITAVDPDRVRRLLGGVVTADVETVRETLVEMDVAFLVALGTGVVTAVIAVTRLIEVAVHDYPVPTFAFFGGLIGASALVLYSEVDLSTRDCQAAAVGGFLLAFLVSGIAGTGLGTGPLVSFVAGAVAVSAMVLPGISGSLLLIILGQYTRMVTALQSTVEGVAAIVGGGSGVDGSSVVTVVTFLAGAVVGLFTVAHAVRFAIEHRRDATLAFLVSLIVGGLRAPADRIASAVGVWTGPTAAVTVLAAAVGVALVVLVDRSTGTITY